MTLLEGPDNGERLMAKEKADGKSNKNPATFLEVVMGKWRKSSPITNMWTICIIWILPAFHLNYKTLQVLNELELNLDLI